MKEKIDVYIIASDQKRQAILETEKMLRDLDKYEKSAYYRFNNFSEKTSLKIDEIVEDALFMSGHNTGIILWFDNFRVPYIYGMVDELLLGNPSKIKKISEIHSLSAMYPEGEARRWFTIMELFDQLGLPLYLEGNQSMSYMDIWKGFGHINKMSLVGSHLSAPEKMEYIKKYAPTERTFTGTIQQIWNYQSLFLVRHLSSVYTTYVYYQNRYVDQYSEAGGLPVGALSKASIASIVRKDKIALPLREAHLISLIKQMQDEKMVVKWA